MVVVIVIYVALSLLMGGGAAAENWPRGLLRAISIGVLVALIWPLFFIL